MRADVTVRAVALSIACTSGVCAGPLGWARPGAGGAIPAPLGGQDEPAPPPSSVPRGMSHKAREGFVDARRWMPASRHSSINADTRYHVGLRTPGRYFPRADCARRRTAAYGRNSGDLRLRRRRITSCTTHHGRREPFQARSAPTRRSRGATGETQLPAVARRTSCLFDRLPTPRSPSSRI
jgi:hypothetical protein